MKYIANSPAKNISSLASHTMVPTWIMFGRLTETGPEGPAPGTLSTTDAVATVAFLPYRLARPKGGRAIWRVGRP